jgi:CRP/FNR family transcriptional regulator
MSGQNQPIRDFQTISRLARERCQRCGVRSLTLCAALPDHQLQRLDDMLIDRSHQHGELVCFEESELDHVAILTEGVLKLSQVLADGRELTVDLLFPGAVLGLCGEAAQHTEAWAVTDVSLCCIPKSKFKRLVDDNPDIEHELLRMKLEQLDRARARMMMLGRKSAAERVASFLTEIAEHHRRCGRHTRDDGVLELELLMGRRGIADYLGLTIETVSRKVQQLARDGVIAVKDPNHIRITDFKALKGLSGD